jgi:hypothetical protein
MAVAYLSDDANPEEARSRIEAVPGVQRATSPAQRTLILPLPASELRPEVAWSLTRQTANEIPVGSRSGVQDGRR